jgi:hypothetical protein
MIKFPERVMLKQIVSPKEKVAFHEAGHAVACSKFELNFSVVKIELNATNKFEGYLITPDLLFNSKAFTIWGCKKAYSLSIIQYFSGIISEAFFCGEYDWTSAQDDMEQVRFVKTLNDNIPSELFLWRCTERWVIKYWTEIYNLALLVLEKNELSKKDIESHLFQQTLKLTPPAL